MTDNSKRTGVAIEAHYQFLAWLVPTNRKISEEPQVDDQRPYRNNLRSTCSKLIAAATFGESSDVAHRCIGTAMNDGRFPKRKSRRALLTNVD